MCTDRAGFSSFNLTLGAPRASRVFRVSHDACISPAFLFFHEIWDYSKFTRWMTPCPLSFINDTAKDFSYLLLFRVGSGRSSAISSCNEKKKTERNSMEVFCTTRKRISRLENLITPIKPRQNGWDNVLSSMQSNLSLGTIPYNPSAPKQSVLQFYLLKLSFYFRRREEFVESQNYN